MGKLKALFNGKKSPDEQPQNDRRSDYAVKKNKWADILARILSILAAFLLWAYVSTLNNTTEERNFSLISLSYREESALKSEYGLIVQSVNINTLNVTLMGNKNDIRNLTAADVKAYVNLGEIKEAGEYPLKIYVDVPSGITCVAQTVDQVVVSVDKPATKTLTLSADKVSLNGWSLENGCFFGKIALNADEVVLEGSTLKLEKVADVQIRTDAIGSAGGSFTATAKVYFLDSNGNELTDTDITVQGERDLRVNVEVQKSKQVKLKLKGNNGYLGEELISITPAYVQLTGEPKMIDQQSDEWVIGSIDEKTLKEDTAQSYSLELPGIAVTNGEGEPISSATAVIQVSSLPSRTLTDVPVRRGDSIVGYLTMDIRAVSRTDTAKLQALTVDKVTVYSAENRPLGDLNSMIVSFEEPFRGAVYEYALYAYREAS